MERVRPLAARGLLTIQEGSSAPSLDGKGAGVVGASAEESDLLDLL